MTTRAQTAQRKKAVLTALQQSLGVVTTACRAAQVERRAFYRWVETDPAFRQAVADVAEVALDFAESKLHSQINDGNTTAIIFFLKTKGKGRGYVERQEVVSPNAPAVPRLEIEVLPARPTAGGG